MYSYTNGSSLQEYEKLELMFWVWWTYGKAKTPVTSAGNKDCVHGLWCCTYNFHSSVSILSRASAVKWTKIALGSRGGGAGVNVSPGANRWHRCPGEQTQEITFFFPSFQVIGWWSRDRRSFVPSATRLLNASYSLYSLLNQSHVSPKKRKITGFSSKSAQHATEQINIAQYFPMADGSQWSEHRPTPTFSRCINASLATTEGPHLPEWMSTSTSQYVIDELIIN